MTAPASALGLALAHRVGADYVGAGPVMVGCIVPQRGCGPTMGACDEASIGVLRVPGAALPTRRQTALLHRVMADVDEGAALHCRPCPCPGDCDLAEDKNRLSWKWEAAAFEWVLQRGGVSGMRVPHRPTWVLANRSPEASAG